MSGRPPRGASRGRGPRPGQGPGSTGRGSSPSRGRGSPVPPSGGDPGPRGRGYPRGRPPPGGGYRGSSPGSFRGGGPSGPPQIFAAGQPLAQDPRLGPELDQLVQAFSRVRIQPEMPLRPGWGTLGRPGQLRTNFFAVRLPKNATYYEYEIEISPKAQAKGDRRYRIMELVEQDAAFADFRTHVAHDRSQRLVSARELPQPLSISVRYLEVDQEDNPNAQTFTVDIKHKRQMSMSTLNDYMDGRPEHRDIDTQPLVSALNLVVQSHASKHGIRVGSNKYFFPSPNDNLRLSLGVEAHRGFFMSIRPMYKQLMVNVNVCMTAFYTPGNLAECMLAFRRETSGGMPHGFADKLKVATRHLGYTKKHTIFRVMTSLTARTARFDCEEYGRKVSVEEFFKLKYRITLRHATDVPIINVSSNPKHAVFLPAEICEIVRGQAYRGKLDGQQTSSMIRYACNAPDVNGNAIVNEGFEKLGLRGGAASTLGSFGVTVSPQMTVVPSRVLPSPGISYSVGNPRIQNASWNIVNIKLQAGGTIGSWAVLLVQDGRTGIEFAGEDDPQLILFLRTFLAKCNSSGIVGADKPPKILSVQLPPSQGDENRAAALDKIRLTFRNNLNRSAKPSFVLVLLSGIDKYIYPGIKKMCDIDLGLQTVHMLLPKARESGNRQDQYFSNVVLKVNAKLGGMNHLLDSSSMKWLTEKKTMIMGIDVTHPGPKSLPGSPSIAAVVASIDDNFVQFPASMTLQKPDWNKESKEMVEKLTQMTIERLQVYQKKNKRLPDRVFVYRDGVSEGQYHLVLQEELPKIQAAFKQISPKAPYKPTLTIAICGKRHHARFWPTAPGEMTNNGNTIPGTIVDKGITDVYNFDFYLQAHNGLKGHVRPTHYTVVYDENRYRADVLQQGTHTASYLFARATKAVSLVPAAYYADIACERGRDYLNVLLNLTEDRSSVTGSADKEAEKERVYQNAVKLWGDGIHKDMKDCMFYI